MKALLLKSAIIRMIQEETKDFHPVGQAIIYFTVLSILVCSITLTVGLIQYGAPNF